MQTKLRILTQSLLFSAKCVLCTQSCANDFGLCEACLNLMPYAENYCLQCGIALATSQQNCGQCIIQPPPFTRTISHCWYQEPLPTLLAQYKFQQALYLARIFARLMAHNLTQYYQQHQLLMPQCLIPVPLHPTRLAQRGYNQANVLAIQLGKLLKINYSLRHCRRIIATESQVSIPANLRQRNMKNAFQTKPLPYRRIAIVDDVMTTGSTVTELSHMFKQQGVAEIHIWCCARTILD